MRVIVGLGNPGKRYENSKHNLGFITIDRLAHKHGIKVNKLKHKALTGEGNIAGEKVLLVKPQTFMNLSGASVREVLEYYKQPPENLIVVYDDIDIAMGGIRIRKKGSAGSHNGMKSVINDIVSDDFPRIRIGIGGGRKSDMVDYVLGGFDKEARGKVGAAVDNAVAAIECMLESGIDKAMNEYNVKPRLEKEQKDD